MPNKVSLDIVANVLHRLGVSVVLSGWEPPTGDTHVQVTDEVAITPTPSKFPGEARVGKEAAENPEIRCFVVLASQHEGQPWETGMKPTRTEIGNDNSQSRRDRALRLLAEIGAAVSR